MRIENELLGVQKNIFLKDYTTFKIGGPAKFFFVAKTKEDLIKAISVAKKLKLPFFIFGGGSNVLAADEGFEGLIIKMQNSKVKMQNDNSKLKIFCEAGAPLSKLLSESFRNGATGLEWAVGIPGTVGGAIYGNAGAFGKSMADITKTVTVLEIKNKKLKIKNLTNRDCKFNYRNSIFKENKNLIILSAILQLKKGNKKEIQKKMKEYLSFRKETQSLNFPSAGSVFKNPKFKIQNSKLLEKFPEMKGFKKNGFIPAGWLIEKCGLKGKRIGNVEISEKHANFILNLGNGKAKDVKKLINLIKKEIKNKFGIILEEEIQYLGNFQ